MIPCFNYARFLPSAVASVVAQEGVDVELIIVDDASSDGSADVARRLARGDRRVTVVAHDRNRGPVEAFNDGLRRVSGEYLVRLDADDMLTPGALGRAVALARAHPEVGLVYGHPLHFTGDPPRARTHVRSWTVWPGSDWLAARCRDGCNVITSPEVLMRASVVREVGGQRDLAHTHDMEMWLRIAAFSDVGRVDGPDQAWHREHPESLSARCVDALTDLRERRAAFDVLFSGAAGGLPDAVALHHAARVALARDALTQAIHQYDGAKATDASVAALAAFARETQPADMDLREWRVLRGRMSLGVAAIRRRPWYQLARLRRRVQRDRRHRRWARTGSYEGVRTGRRSPPAPPGFASRERPA